MIHLVHLQRQSMESLFHSKKQFRKYIYLLFPNYKFIQIIVNRTQRKLTQGTRLDHSICFCRNCPQSHACKTPNPSNIRDIAAMELLLQLHAVIVVINPENILTFTIEWTSVIKLFITILYKNNNFARWCYECLPEQFACIRFVWTFPAWLPEQCENNNSCCKPPSLPAPSESKS